MARTMLLLLCAALVAVWIASAWHNQASVGPDEHTVRAQLTAVAGPITTK